MEMLSHGQAEQRVLERAAADPAFRAELKANPRAALESELGIQIPEEVSVQVHEETLSEMHLVLPPSEELSEAELEMASGAGGDVCWGNCPNDIGPG
jgi:hypothetical protein